MADVKEFVIDRATWRRGCGPGCNVLRGKDGLQCAQGFYGAALGVADDHLLDVIYTVTPDKSLRAGDPSWPAWLFDDAVDCEERHDLARINDSRDFTEEDRERLIVEHFAKHGVTVHFVGERTLP